MQFFAVRTIQGSVDQALERVSAALKAEGFGVLSQIDLTAVMKATLGETVRPYRILGVGNPQLALRAIAGDDKVGIMLPCNVIVQEKEAGKVEIAIINPRTTMEAIGVRAVTDVVDDVTKKLQRVLGAI